MVDSAPPVRAEKSRSRVIASARGWLSGILDRLAARAARVGYLVNETRKLWANGEPAVAAQVADVKVGGDATIVSAHAIDPEESDATELEWNPAGQWRRTARRTFMTVAAFSLFVNLLMLTVPIYLFQLSDRVLTSHSIDTLLMLSILAVTFLGVLSLLDIARRQVLGGLANRLEGILGGPLLASAISNPKSADGSSTQTIRNLHQVRNFISGPTMLVLFDAPMAPVYLAAIFLISPPLGVIAFVCGIILAGIAWINQRMTSELLGRAGAFASNADARADALARNSQIINAMGMLNESILHWGVEHARALTSQSNALGRNFWISGTSKFLRLVTQVSVLGFGAYLALQGQITGGMMIAASIIASRGLQPLEGMIDGWRSVVGTRAAYAQVVAQVEEFQREKVRLKLPRPEGRIVAERLLYIPPGSKDPILNGISFELEPGQSLAIVGPSGSGKSTLARLLVGCLNPTVGNVRLDGTDLRNWDRRQFGAYTGYLPQEVELFPGTIRENICRMQSDLPDSDVHAAAVIAGVHIMIANLPNGYETVLEGTGAPLSGGQRQRIALARALFGDPRMIVLDEPNSNLDADGEKALNDTLRRAKARKVTVIVITQRPALLKAVDRLLVLRSGRAVAFGPPEKVLHRLIRSEPGTESEAEAHAVSR